MIGIDYMTSRAASRSRYSFAPGCRRRAVAGQDSLMGPRRVVRTAFALRGPGTTTETTGAASRAGIVMV